MTSKTKNVAWVTIISLISLIVLLLINFPTIKENLSGNSVLTDIPFTIEISPEYFGEGNYDNYDKISFSIKLIKKSGRNITYLELPKDSFKISRKDRGLNKPTSQVNWEDSRSENILSINPYGYEYYYSSNLKAKGEMSICKNCFIGTDYPYVFTFTIYYKEGDGELKSETFAEEIPIK